MIISMKWKELLNLIWIITNRHNNSINRDRNHNIYLNIKLYWDMKQKKFKLC